MTCRERDGERDYLELNEEVRNAKKLQGGIDLVTECEDLLKVVNKKLSILWEKRVSS